VKLLHVIQHTSAEYLGLVEDHLEGRGIRFRYFRPFTEGTPLPSAATAMDGLVLLGGGPWGTTGDRRLPSLAEEVSLARVYLMSGKSVIGIGLGAQILALAADGQTEPAPLTFSVGRVRRTMPGAMNGFLPETMPHVLYMRDFPLPPAYATTLALDDQGRPAIFQIGDNVFGFTGHPGFKRAMAEDLIMEFEEAPANPSAGLAALGSVQRELEDSLVPLMTGLVQKTGLMQRNQSQPLL
jgi:GMP synthase-like glutamine amidotransferase